MRTPRTAVLVVLPVLVALTGCGGGSDTPTVSAPASSAPAMRASTSATSPTGEQSPSSVDQVVHLTYRNGQVSGDTGRVKVKLGSTVQVVVTSDVADEVHLHGYNKMVDVPAGGTAKLTFTANIPGIFEIELESRSHKLTEFEIS